MNLPSLHKLFDHMEWADALVWNTVLDEDPLHGDNFIVDGLFHVHLVQFAYLSVWQRQDLSQRTRQDFTDPADVKEWAQAYYPAADAFLTSLSESDLAEVIDVPWTEFIEAEIGGPPAPATLGDMILQVASHSGHHRAQINRRIRELGGTPHMIDYIGWVWRGCPPAPW